MRYSTFSYKGFGLNSRKLRNSRPVVFREKLVLRNFHKFKGDTCTVVCS